MENTSLFVKKENYLHLAVTGNIDEMDIMSFPKLVRDECEKERIYKVLVDCLKITGTEASVIRRYLLGNEIAKVLGFKIKLAVVWPANDISKVTENVAVNRGANILVSGDIETAKKWLLGS